MSEIWKENWQATHYRMTLYFASLVFCSLIGIKWTAFTTGLKQPLRLEKFAQLEQA